MVGADASSATLLERASELTLLEEAIAATAGGAPRAILIEGPAGIGKTALLRAARQGADRAGLRVLAARGGELERELSLGIERQLFEPLLVRASKAARTELLARPATAVSRLFGLAGTDSNPSADEYEEYGEYESHNALYWLCARLAGHSPVMLAIDDVHWADATSLRFLAYLIRRLDDLPVLLALTRRVDEPGAVENLLGQIAAEPLVQVVRPGPLSLAAVHDLASARFETEPQDGFVLACHQATGGIPLFTLQLLDEARARCLQPVEIHAEAVAELAPERVLALVLGRLRRLSPIAVTVAEHVALLGSQAEVRHVKALADLGESQVLTAGDELTAAGLFRSGQPLEFSHPVFRASVYESVPAGRRASIHGRAARLLSSENAAPTRIAMHLLNAPADGDQWAVEVLKTAASAEVRPESRAVYLRRALAEPNPDDIRAALLAELGRAEWLTYDTRAIDHLTEVLRLSKDRPERAAAAARLASSLVEHDRAEDAEPILRHAIAELSQTSSAPDPAEKDLLLGLNAGLLHAELVAGELRRQRLDQAIEMASEGRSPAELDLLAMAAYVAPAAKSTANEVGALADRVLQGNALNLEDLMPALTAIWALELADRLDDADHWLLRVMDEAQRRQSPGQFMLAASARADLSSRRGALADAEQDATTALELAQSHGRDYSVYVSAAALTMSLTEQGRLAEAEAAATEVRDSRGAKCDRAIYVCCRAWLRIAQRRPAQALEEFQEAGNLACEAGHDLPGFWAWRLGAATALLALDRRVEARDLAREQLQLARPFAAPGPIGAALRTLGLVEPAGQAQLDLLRAATLELERSPALLERARAQLEFGAALRRAGQRIESRPPLRAALDLADRCGALPVAQRAREELLAAGGRPRRARIGGVEALTASEARVAQRAAGGRTNREIAQELFVTVKVVEKHLASAYRKLGIQGRGELSDAIGQALSARTSARP